MSYKMHTLQSSGEDSYLIIQLWMKQIGWNNHGKGAEGRISEEVMRKLNSCAKNREQKCPRQREKDVQWLWGKTPTVLRTLY